MTHQSHDKTCTGEAINSSGGRKAEILLAEDNPADIYLIREALQEHGIECPVQVACDGKEVLQILAQLDLQPEENHLGLIILDLNLPRHDGIEILQKLRETPRMAHIPVAVLTSSDSPRDREVATRLGAARYLRKPSNLEQFLDLGAVFKDLLAGRQSEFKAV